MILTGQVEQLRNELEKRKREFDGHVKELKTVIAYKRQNAETAKSQLGDLGTSFSISNTKIESLRTQLEEVAKERDDQAEHISGLLTNTIPALQAAEQLSTKRADDLAADVARFRQHAEKSAADANRFRIKYDELAPELDKAVEGCADRDNRIITLSEENVKLQEQLSASARHSGKLDRQIAMERQTIAKIEHECLTKEAEIQRLEASQSTASTEHQSTRNEMSWKDGGIADLTHRLGESRLQAATELADKDGQLTELSRKLRESRFNTERLEHTLSGKDDQTKALNAQVKELQDLQAAKVESSEIELTRRNDQIKDLFARVDDLEKAHAAEISRLTTELTDREHALSGKDGQIKDLNAQVEEIQESQAAEVESSKIELTQRDDQIKDLTARLDGLQNANAAEIHRFTTELTGKDGQINALTAELQDLQRTSAARNDQRESEFSSKVDLINDLNAEMDDLQRANTAEIHQLKAELSEKDNQITELKRKEGVLRQDQDNSRNASRQKDSELAGFQGQLEELRAAHTSKDQETMDLQEQLEELRTTLTSQDQETVGLQEQLEELRTTITSKDDESTELREQFQDLQDAASSKDSDLEKATLDLIQLHRTRSTEVRDLKSKANDDADMIRDLRGRLQRVQGSSEAKSMKLQQDLDSQRVTTTDFSQQVELQKRDLEKNERQMRQQEARISSLAREVAQLEKDKEDMGRDADSGMDHLESERYEAEKKRDRAEEKLKDMEEELSDVQEWLEVSREEVRKLEARNASTRQAGTGLQPRPSRDTSIDEEQEMLDEPVIPQLERTSLRGQTDAPSNIGRKRKSADMASDEEGESGSENNTGSNRPSGAAVRPRNLATSSSNPPAPATYAVSGGIGPVVSTITPFIGGTFTVSVADAKARNLTSSVIPAAVLDILRMQITDWSECLEDWSRHIKRNKRRCVMMRVRKRKSLWDDGDNFGCKTCQDAGRICTVVQEGDNLQLLPRKGPGNAVLSPSDKGYWLL